MFTFNVLYIRIRSSFINLSNNIIFYLFIYERNREKDVQREIDKEI